MKLDHAAALAFFTLMIWPQSVAFTQCASTVARIEVTGNHQVSEHAIRDHISSKVGQPCDPNKVDADIRSIYHMGNFKAVHAHFEQGEILVITVDEKTNEP
jgi:outer membrane protein insertion porin family